MFNPQQNKMQNEIERFRNDTNLLKATLKKNEEKNRANFKMS